MICTGPLALLILASFGPDRGRPGPLGSGPACDSTAPQPLSYPVDAVDSRPVLVRPGRSLRYPPGLLMTGLTGDVQLEYAVDTTGAVDPCSIRILGARRPAFAASARAFVSGLQFTPGLKNGVPVRTRLQQTIRFRQRNGDRGKHHVF
jgi:TonB family protein